MINKLKTTTLYPILQQMNNERLAVEPEAGGKKPNLKSPEIDFSII